MESHGTEYSEHPAGAEGGKSGVILRAAAVVAPGKDGTGTGGQYGTRSKPRQMKSTVC